MEGGWHGDPALKIGSLKDSVWEGPPLGMVAVNRSHSESKAAGLQGSMGAGTREALGDSGSGQEPQ